MPAFNAEKYISESINSVINQTYKNWELIIINDGSTDNTENIILNYTQNNPQIKYLSQQNGKQGKARNLGITNSAGSYIAFLDADDIWTLEKLEVQINCLQQYPHLDLVFSQGYYLHNESVSNFNVAIKSLWDNNDIGTFIKSNQIPILSAIVKKTCLLSVNGFEEDKEIQNVEDYDLWIRLLLNNFKFVSIPNRLFYYRVHENQATYNVSNLSLPIINMFGKLYATYHLVSYKNIILERIKWSLFIEDMAKKSFQIIIKIMKATNPLIVGMAKLTYIMPYPKLKFRLIFKMLSWI